MPKLKADIELIKEGWMSRYWFYSANRFNDCRDAGFWEQIIAIVLGWADPVEVD